MQNLEIPDPRQPGEQIPQEWYEELRAYPPESKEHQMILQVLGELATEGGIDPADDAPGDDKSSLPPGFKGKHLLDQPAALPLDQFDGRIKGIEGTEPLSVPVLELITDQGKRVRMCDLRPILAKSTGRTGAQDAAGQARLDRYFWQDLKNFVDGEGVRRSVEGVQGVYYARAGNDTPRVFFMAVTDMSNTDKVLMFARIGDSMTIRDQKDLYRRLFGIKLKK